MAHKTVQTANRPWTPSETELRVAEYLATGHSQNRAARLVGMDPSTVSLWYQREEFRALVADMTVRFLESTGDVLDSSEALAALLVHQVLTGERERDGATDLARDLLGATVWKKRAGEKWQAFGKAAEDVSDSS